MGTFSVTIGIGDLGGQQFSELEAMVDTGATTTVIPSSVLRGLGIRPTEKRVFEYADGREVELDMAQATVRVEGKETITWVIFGDEGAGALLGAYTLEGVFLGVDPYNQRITPVHSLLK